MKTMQLLVVLAVAAGPAAGTEWLCRVEPGPGGDVLAANRYGADVLMPLSDGSLCRADADDLARMDAAGVAYEMLDVDPDAHSYVYAMPAPGFDRARLASCGTVLTSDRDGVVLRTDAAGIQALNRLPVELAGVGVHPVRGGVETAPPEPCAVDDSLLWELVGRVSADTLEEMFNRLIGFRTRYSPTDSCHRAMEWTRDMFEAYGCDSAYMDTFQAEMGANAVGVKRGTSNDRQVFAVFGHVDATSEDPYNFAPGSEDNASGALCALELCRVFEGIETEKTVWFIGFSGEEQGLVGSDSFARRARDRGDSIMLAVNFDMVSYGRENLDTIVIYGARSNPNSEQFVDFFRAQADTFSALKHYATIEQEPAARSDHYSFWKYGFPAIRGGYHDRTPTYHTTGDTIGPMYYRYCGTNNIPMHAELVKALVVTVAKLAGAHVPTGVAEGGRMNAELRLPTVVRAPDLARLDLRAMDATGRDVTDRRGQLGPGVYFVGPVGGRWAGRKVVVQR